jgi:hypothetical protein
LYLLGFKNDEYELDEACMGEKKNACRKLVGKSDGKRFFVGLIVDGRLIF